MSVLVDQTIAVSRLQKDVDNIRKEMLQPNLALQNVRCQIQPASPEQTAIANGVFGQTFVAFTTASGILTGDRITVSGTGQAYRVRGVEDWSQIEGIPHYEVIMVMMQEEEVFV